MSCRARIAEIKTWPVLYPIAGYFKFFEGPPGRPWGRAAVVIQITDENGQSGWGESVPVPRWSYETVESVHTTIESYLKPELIGCDAFDAEKIEALMAKAISPSFSTGQPICKSGIDLALHDLRGKLLGQPVAGLWGKQPKPITLSWTVNARSLAEVEELLEQGSARGYSNFNVKVAPDLNFDLELCRLVKKFSPDGFLWADANGGYDETTALQAAPKLAEIGVAVLEQPLPANRLSGYAKLKRQKALPILMDEGVVSSVELEEFIRLELLDGVAMKPARCGGLTEAKRQIEILHREGLMFLGTGLTDPDLALSASLALYGAFDLQYPAALNGPQFLAASLLTDPFVPRNGVLQAPNKPGLGVEISIQQLAKLHAPYD